MKTKVKIDLISEQRRELKSRYHLSQLLSESSKEIMITRTRIDAEERAPSFTVMEGQTRALRGAIWECQINNSYPLNII